MGLIYYELEQFDNAEDCFQSALGRNRNSPKIWNNLGVLYFYTGQYEKARDCFEAALSLFSQYYDALYNIRDTCRELKDYKAAAEFERILKESFSAHESGRFGT
jgi:tetratricopeptide (TPR) repeat protein